MRTLVLISALLGASVAVPPLRLGTAAVTPRRALHPAAAATASAARAHVAAGRYRLVATGFTVNHETWDNALQTDGRRDEVYVESRAAVIDRAGNTVSQLGPVRTRILGDVNWQTGRVQAGSASNLGGLRTGDTYPVASPLYAFAGLPVGGGLTTTSTTGGLPLELWRGELTAGGTGVAAIPAIWEYDGPTDVVTQFGQFLGSLAAMPSGSLAQAMFSGAGQFVVDAAAVGRAFSSVSFLQALGRNGDRPVGTDVVGTTATGTPLYGFKSAQVVTLTYESAEALLASNPTGRGNGVLAIRYVDEPKYAGDYTLYLKLERLP